MDVSDEDLIQAYLDGDEQSLVVLVERHFAGMYSYVFRFVRNTAEAEDIVQDVFIKVWKQLHRFQPGTGLRPWLFRIARNTAIDHLRKKKSIPLSFFEHDGNEAVFVDADNDVVEQSIAREEKAVLVAAVEELPLHYREILLLRAEEQLTFEEISATVGKPLNTVKSLYRRGLLQLHQIINAKRSN